MVKVGPLTAEIGWQVWGTPWQNFNRFRVLASSLHRRRSTEVNQILHDVWPSPALVHYNIHFRGLLPLTEFYQVQNSFCVQVLRSPILAALLHIRHSSSFRQPNCGVQQRAPPIFGRAAITLGVDLHSSLVLLFFSPSTDFSTSMNRFS